MNKFEIDEILFNSFGYKKYDRNLAIQCIDEDGCFDWAAYDLIRFNLKYNYEDFEMATPMNDIW